MVLLTKAMSIYFEVNPSKFLPVTGSKIDECTLLGSSRTYESGPTTNLSKTLYNVTFMTYSMQKGPWSCFDLLQSS